MEASSQLTQLLKISSVAGIFVCLILGITAAVWVTLGVGEVKLLVLMWGTLFIGLPQFGMLYVGLKRREYLRDILGALQKD
jgi:ABC-type arginine transport system permease subunit